MRRKILSAIAFVFALFLLTACQPAAPAPVTPSATPPAPTSAPATETLTPTATPEAFMINGTEAETVQRGDSYFYTNPVNNREVQVAKIVDGKMVKEKFLDKQLVSCTASEAEIRANVLPLELVDPQGADISLANKIAMVADKEAFSDEVVTGQNVEEFFSESTKGIKSGVLRWDEKTQDLYEANPEKKPYKIHGCFSIKSSIDGENEIYIGVVHSWKNSDGTERFVTTLYKDSFFFSHSPEELVFASGFRDLNAPDSAFKLACKIAKNQEKKSITSRMGRYGKRVYYDRKTCFYRSRG